MQEKKQLWEMIEQEAGRTNLAGIEVPAYIRENLRFELFDWQVSALQYFMAYEDPKYRLKRNAFAPSHLLFNMATGTGKTLLMAALLLYYYKKGYRNFIFLVNQNNIVGKTEENLVNPQHIKYLFKQSIVIDNKTISIKKVNTFSSETDDIEILFTTVHKLHNAVYAVRENNIYLEDLQKRNIVLLADEAHHLNADTKKKKGAQLEFDELETELTESAGVIDLEKSWENTICKKILERKGTAANQNENKNVLIEFTATVPNELSVAEKYNDKTVFRFDLPAFLNAGYTKEINLVTSTADTKQIILQALLFNWYRNAIALRNKISNFKPVILFRSKTIADSINDLETFRQLIGDLSAGDFDFLQQISDEAVDGKEVYLKGKSRLVDLKYFIAENNISFPSIIHYLQYAFSAQNCIITNSKDRSAKGKRGEEKTTEEQDKLLNSLEDKNNPITAIFTVQRLNEGWDVLNLFDIVRLYTGRDEGKTKTGQRKAGPATTSEVQLIGRGIRYYPFEFENGPRLKRKFDEQLDHELRILEEFYFHSYDDEKNRYIDELKRELKEKGFIDDEKVIKIIAPKPDFTEDPFYKEIKFWKNMVIANPEARKNTLEEIKPGFSFTYHLPSLRLHEEGVVLDEREDKEKYTSAPENRKTLARTFGDFEKHIVRKAINIKAKKENSLFRYTNLKQELNIGSIDEMMQKKFIGDLPINITVPPYYEDLQAIPNKTLLHVLLDFFDTVEECLKDVSNPYIGSEFIETTVSAVFGIPKERVVKQTEESKRLAKELESREWYAFDSFSGTSEEIVMIRFIEENIENLKDRYESIFLLKNEQVYTIYNFKSGKKFQPDYILLLKEKERDSYVQMIIEAKGDQFKDKDGNFTLGKEGWKELFLEQIADLEAKVFQGERYELTTLPFFNENNGQAFRQKFNERLKLNL